MSAAEYAYSVMGSTAARPTVIAVSTTMATTQMRSTTEYFAVIIMAMTVRVVTIAQNVSEGPLSGSPITGARMLRAPAVPPMMPPRWSALQSSMMIQA